MEILVALGKLIRNSKLYNASFVIFLRNLFFLRREEILKAIVISALMKIPPKISLRIAMRQ